LTVWFSKQERQPRARRPELNPLSLVTLTKLGQG